MYLTEISMKFLFFLNAILLFYAMAGYPVLMVILNKLTKKKNIARKQRDIPVSLIISAYNEEKVIEKKLLNVEKLSYPLLEVIVANDGSSDNTKRIVNDFIKNHPNMNLILKNVEGRLGKTNAQNEAVKMAKGDIIVFSDANSMFKEDAIDELISYFTSDDIEYVCGSLIYTNGDLCMSGYLESTYWNMDLFLRKVESNISSIASGNGAIYAVRKKYYRNYDLISSHDYEMPLHAALNGRRALYNEKAICYEKAGESAKDEFKRKVRMQRRILTNIFTNLRRLNIFRYKSFAFFHFSHKTLRFLQAFFHLMIFVTNLFLLDRPFFVFTMIFQIIFYLLALFGKVFNLKNKIFYFPMYYCMMILAQIIGAYKELTGKSRATWEKAESTR